MFNKKISSDFLLLVLLVVRLRLDSDIGLHDRYIRTSESREVFLGSSSAYTQITFHVPYSNIQYPHPKSLEYNEQDEAAILFNRLNYFNSVRERRSNLITYYASSPGVQNAGTSIENANAEAATATGGDSPPGNPSLPTTNEGNLETPGETSCEVESSTSTLNDLSPEDMDLIEILWKQDIDLGVSRDAYDSRPCLEVEKLKDVEYTKENVQEFYLSGDTKCPEESETTPNPLAGLNYTVDSETGEFVLDELSGLSEDEISGAPLLDNDTFTPLNYDSYLPFNEDDAQLSNLTDIFPTDLFPEDYNDSNFFLSHIEDFEKDLESFAENNPGDDAMYSQPGDVFSNIDDCWPDSSSILPLLALGNSHQNPFVSISPRPEATYQNSNPVLPISSNLSSRPNEGFTGILHSSSMEAPSNDETFHSIPAPLGPASVGCAVAESIATLHNDTDPIPASSLINTVYNPDLPELLYSNQSLTTPNNELLMHDFFTDDFALAMPSSEANQRILNEDHVDTSNDSASLASARVPSVSDCPDWLDSCSESSSHHGENRSHSFVTHSARGSPFGHNQSTEIYRSAMLPKRHRHLENSDVGNTDFRGAVFDQSNGSSQPCFTIKSEYSEGYENNAAISSSQLSTYGKFDYTAAGPAGAACSNILQHNHSYHLPFSSSESRYKPVLRDKSKSSSSEDDASNKDEKRAKELKLPISIDDIINLAIEEYNERLSKYELTDQQLNLIRDIRRRGKNKVAAQNCRKRKMDQINSLQQDLDALQNEKMQLKSKQDHLLQQKHCIEDKYAQLYQIVSQYTNCKPPGSSNSLPGHGNNNHQITIPSTPDVAMSDDDSDLSRGARTKRKFKK